MAIPKSKHTLDIRFLSVVSRNCEQESLSQQSNGIKKLGYTAEQVFKNLYERYFKALCQYATERVKDTQLAEDIVSEAFAKLMLQADLHTAHEAEDHLYNAVDNVCVCYEKEQQVIAKGIAVFNVITPSEEAEIEAELSSLIYDELCKLPPQRQQIMVQLYMKGLTSQQVAKQMKLSRQTVLNQKVRALKKLRDNLKKRFFS